MLILRIISPISHNLTAVTIATVLYYVFSNTGYWALVSRYLVVVRGNPYVMDGKRIPTSTTRKGVIMYLLVAVLVVVIPVAYGIFLLCTKLNVFAAVFLTKAQFTWF